MKQVILLETSVINHGLNSDEPSGSQRIEPLEIQALRRIPLLSHELIACSLGLVSENIKCGFSPATPDSLWPEKL